MRIYSVSLLCRRKHERSVGMRFCLNRYIIAGVSELFHVNYYTKIRRPEIFRNAIASGYVVFCQINKFFVNILFFHYFEKALAAG